MSTLLKTTLTALAFGTCSFAIYAAEDGAASAGFSWASCNVQGCTKDIPIKLEVPKKCEITGGSAITLSSAGGPKTSNYIIQTNTPYVLNISTANTGENATGTYVKNTDDNSVHVNTTITTTKNGAPVSFGNSNNNGLATDNFIVTVNNSAVSATQRAGTYTDTYRVKLFY